MRLASPLSLVKVLLLRHFFFFYTKPCHPPLGHRIATNCMWVFKFKLIKHGGRLSPQLHPLQHFECLRTPMCLVATDTGLFPPPWNVPSDTADSGLVGFIRTWSSERYGTWSTCHFPSKQLNDQACHLAPLRSQLLDLSFAISQQWGWGEMVLRAWCVSVSISVTYRGQLGFRGCRWRQ